MYCVIKLHISQWNQLNNVATMCLWLNDLKKVSDYSVLSFDNNCVTKYLFTFVIFPNRKNQNNGEVCSNKWQIIKTKAITNCNHPKRRDDSLTTADWKVSWFSKPSLAISCKYWAINMANLCSYCWRCDLFYLVNMTFLSYICCCCMLVRCSYWTTVDCALLLMLLLSFQFTVELMLRHTLAPHKTAPEAST